MSQYDNDVDTEAGTAPDSLSFSTAAANTKTLLQETDVESATSESEASFSHQVQRSIGTPDAATGRTEFFNLSP